jgi:PBP1b-binding outer membrane lipoprotein LpoB
LRNTNNGELQPEKLEQDLKRILNNPKDTNEILKAKASSLDRDTLVKVLASRNMTEAEAEKRVSQAEKVLDKVNSFFSDTSDKATAKKGELGHKKQDLQARVKGMFSGATAPVDLEQVYYDVTNIFRSSATGPDLQYKLKHYDKEQMTVLITNKTSLSREEAEPIAEKIVSARDNVLSKANEIEARVNEKMAEAKQQALIAAEESRKAAATAAWWLVATAVVSAAASAFGGMLALESWIF